MARIKEAQMSNSKYELECVEVLTSFVILVDADVAVDVRHAHSGHVQGRR